MKYKLTTGLLFILFLTVFNSRSSFAESQKKIVTTFTIIQDMAKNVAGDAASVVSITKPGAEIHEYEVTPLDIVKAQQGNLILWNGLGLERWFEKFLLNLKGVSSVNLTDGIEPISIVEGPYLGKPNPHSWMSPANALIYVQNIKKALIDLDPQNQQIYEQNAKNYSDKINAVNDPIRQKLAQIPSEQRWLVSSEGAFSYLNRDYGLKELYLWPVNADQEGTPQQVRKVIDTVRSNNIPVVFSESTISDKAMRQVAKETGARYGGVLYVDSLTTSDGPAPDYISLLEYNANIIVQGFLVH